MASANPDRLIIEPRLRHDLPGDWHRFFGSRSRTFLRNKVVLALREIHLALETTQEGERGVGRLQGRSIALRQVLSVLDMPDPSADVEHVHAAMDRESQQTP